MKINFDVQPAFVITCSVCEETLIGGPPGQTEKTDIWIAKHGKFHSDTGSTLAPPQSFINGK